MPRHLLRIIAVLAFLLLSNHCSQSQSAQLTNLPTVYLTTKDGAEIKDKTTWVDGTIEIVSSGTYPGRTVGPMQIRGRGNSTWYPDKKPYRIRLPSNAENKSLLGMPSQARNWVLLANYFDISLIRNALAFEISKFLGFAYTTPYRFVDVVLNGTHVGNYMLTDHIQVENNRVEVETLSNSDTDLEKISGGYFIQEDTYARDESGHYQSPPPYVSQYEIKYPDADDINSAQRAYITNYLANFESRLNGNNFLHPTEGYNAVIDRVSQVNWELVNAMTANRDSYQSTYLYKLRSDPKIYFGPIWDHDKSFNNNDGRADLSYRAISEDGTNTSKIERMLEDPGFIASLSNRWKELRAQGIYAFVDSKITSFSTEIEESRKLNFSPSTANHRDISESRYQDEITVLRNFWRRKVGFLDYHLTREIYPNRRYRIGSFTNRHVIASSASHGLSVERDSLENAGTLRDWSLIPAGGGYPGYYKIKNVQTQRVLARSGSSVYLENESPDRFLYQIWRIENIPNQSYVAIYSYPTSGTTYVLQSSGGGVALNTVLTGLESSTSRRWFLVNLDVQDTSLPVTLSDFRAKVASDGVTLDWRVTEVSNFSHFEIERMGNGEANDGEGLGKVYFREGASQDYQFVDESPSFGMNYYRLKMVDRDGSYRYSHFISARFSGVSELQTYPIPASGEINLSFVSKIFSGTAEAILYDNLGKKSVSSSLEVKTGKNDFKIDLAGLTPGLYHLKLELGGEVINKNIAISD